MQTSIIDDIQIEPSEGSTKTIPFVPEEASPIKRAASDTLNISFLEKLKGYEKLNDELIKVGVYVGGNICGMVFYFFTVSNEKAFLIDAYWPNYEAGYLRKNAANSGAKSPCYPFRKIKESSKGRFLQIKDLDKTEIEYKHLIE
jgi:hypothetical protein